MIHVGRQKIRTADQSEWSRENFRCALPQTLKCQKIKPKIQTGNRQIMADFNVTLMAKNERCKLNGITSLRRPATMTNTKSINGAISQYHIYC
jgi:hypothetical protein